MSAITRPLPDLDTLPDAVTAAGWRGCDTARSAIERRAEFRRANWRGQSAAPLRRLRALAEQETAEAAGCRCHVCAGGMRHHEAAPGAAWPV